MKETIMNQEKLAKLQAQVRIGGKGTARRKKVVHRMATADDKKLQFSLKKLGVNNICGTEEVNMFTSQGTVIHFNTPKLWLEKHHLLPERRMMVKFQILWRILMKLPRMKQTELSQLLKNIKPEE
ncbi:hypothetical protein GH733_004186, partial [Mirounga leonina]